MRGFLLLLVVVCLTNLTPVAHADSAKQISLGNIKDYRGAALVESILQEAYGALGIEVNFLYLPLARSLRMSNLGQLDGEAARTKAIEKESRDLVRIPTPLLKVQGVVFIRKAQESSFVLADSKPKTIGIVAGELWAKKVTRDMTTVEITDSELLFVMLRRGRVDAIITTDINGKKLLAETHDLSITILEPALVTFVAYTYLHKKHRNLVELLSLQLQRMHESGRILQLEYDYFQSSKVK